MLFAVLPTAIACLCCLSLEPAKPRHPTNTDIVLVEIVVSLSTFDGSRVKFPIITTCGKRVSGKLARYQSSPANTSKTPGERFHHPCRCVDAVFLYLHCRTLLQNASCKNPLLTPEFYHLEFRCKWPIPEGGTRHRAWVCPLADRAFVSTFLTVLGIQRRADLWLLPRKKSR